MTLQKEPIERLPVTEAQKALGIYTRPDGNMVDEKEHLRQLAEKWAGSLRTRRVHKNDAWYCLNATILKSIEYPLVVTTFTRDDCAYIMALILTAGLLSVRVQQNMPQTLVYAPLKFQGLGISDPWAVQLIEHLHVIL